jgi:hypothetical protein
MLRWYDLMITRFDAYGYIVTTDTVISMYSRMSATFTAFLAARADKKRAQLSK